MKKLIFTKIIVAVFIVLFTHNFIQAGEPLLIVTNPWPPYSFKANNAIIGTDVEIIEAVFAQLKIPIRIQFYPWKRCLIMVENRKADAILDASITPERKAFLHFPKEPVSEATTVFFIKKDREIPFTTLNDLDKLRVGAILGYSYCDEIDNTPFMKDADRVSVLDQNFRKLLVNRIDFLVEVEAVGYYTAEKMGISDQIDIIPKARYCWGGNYLAFAKKNGYDQHASQFGQALQTFKSTDAYLKILEKYGVGKSR